jgi:hypothetical protein
LHVCNRLLKKTSKIGDYVKSQYGGLGYFR